MNLEIKNILDRAFQEAFEKGAEEMRERAALEARAAVLKHIESATDSQVSAVSQAIRNLRPSKKIG